jgi:putative thioredoxin
MTALPYVFDGTHDNFRQLVLANSHKGPVLVNYWTPNAGPCFKLWQVLEKLSQEYNGRFLLVNVNTATQSALVRENGITSVPTVKIYQQGRIVESIYGAQSETSMRAAIDKYVAPARDTPIAEAIRNYQAGDADGALEVLVHAGMQEPGNPKLHATALKLLLRERRYDDIESYVAVLPEPVKTHPEIGTLEVHARMLHLAQQAPSAEELDKHLEAAPDDKDATLSRAAVAMVHDDYETALQRLLRLLREDRHYRDDIARKAMLVIFALLGDQHQLTRAFQKSMREILH